MRLHFAAATHVGMRRTMNQDSYVTLPEHGVFAVADGMGGHLSGEIASQLAIESLEDFFVQTADDEDVTWPFGEEMDMSYGENRLSVAIKVANTRIRGRSRVDPNCRRMGTTIVATLFMDDHVAVAHVGDSRAYRLRGKELTRLTSDHSLVNRLLRETPSLGEDDPGLARYRHVIVRALGMDDRVEVDVSRLPMEAGDTYLLCSDGLTGEVDDDGIREILLNERVPVEDRARRLLDLACELGGHDNITVVLVSVQPPQAELEASTAT